MRTCDSWWSSYASRYRGLPSQPTMEVREAWRASREHLCDLLIDAYEYMEDNYNCPALLRRLDAEIEELRREVSNANG